MRKVAVVGVGETKFSGPQEKTEVELFAEAAMDALNESSLKPKDIQALFIGNCLGDFSEGQGMVQAFAAENIGCLGIPATRYEGACASASMAVRDAFLWVASGFYDIVLAGGTERAATMGTPLGRWDTRYSRETSIRLVMRLAHCLTSITKKFYQNKALRRNKGI